MSGNQRVLLQPAYILHRRPFRETSLLLNVFTYDFGRVSLVAKGARRSRSTWSGLLQPFTAVRLSWTEKTDLGTLVDAESGSLGHPLAGRTLFCGLYVNELIERLLGNRDPYPDLFRYYETCLTDLAAGGNAEVTLRCFEFDLLNEIGYGLQLECDATDGKPLDPCKRYRYEIEIGPLAVAADEDTIRGSSLIALRERRMEDSIALAEVKRLMRRVIQHHLGGKPLNSRSLFGHGSEK